MPILFSKFNVTRQVFYTSKLSFGVVNLKPLIPGHVLICPHRVVLRLQDLAPHEITDLFLTVQKVGMVLERAYSAEALTISCQDGKTAGQSVPHVHIHLIPRKSTDFDGDNDRIYPALEAHEQGLRGVFVQQQEAEKRWDPHQGDGDSSGSRTTERENLEAVAGAGARKEISFTGLSVPKDDERVPRTEEEMQTEAEWLASFFREGTSS